jgi:hypothetical protein
MDTISKRWIPCLSLLLFVAMDAEAQGEPPFGTGNRGESVQISEVFLAIRDTTPSGCCTLEMLSDDELRVVQIQDEGEADAASLLVAPEHVFAVGPGGGGGSGLPAGDSTGEFWVVGGGTYYKDGSYVGRNDAGTGVFPEFVKTDSASSFDMPAGTMDVSAEVVTSDYGLRYETENGFWYHTLRSVGNARLRDWVFVSGPGPTAIVSVTATIDASVDVPVSLPLSNADFWTTQPYGDLRELSDPFEPSGSDPYLRFPSVDQETRFDAWIEIKRWTFEEFCEDTDEDGIDDSCYEEWVDEVEASASGVESHETVLEYEYPPFETPIPHLIPYDTDTLGETLTAQATVPTGIWLEVDARVAAEVQCDGVLQCDLDARSGDPVTLSITSPDGTLVAWRGIAGLTRVPEPVGAAAMSAAIAALGALARRGSRTTNEEVRR